MNGISECRVSREGERTLSTRLVLPMAAMVALLLLLPPGPQPLASITNFSFTKDTDKDALPDTFEILIGTSYLNPDTDGDGFIDGVEYILRSDPFDGASKPSYQPAVRIAAYKENQVINLQISFFPGDLDLLDAFTFKMAYLASGNYTPDSVPSLDLTNLMPYTVQQVSYVNFKGFLISSYVVSLPENLLEEVSPASFGVGCQIADIFVWDTADLDFIDGQPVRFIHGLDAGLGENEGYYLCLADDPSLDWSEDEVCKTEMVLKNSHDGISTYEVNDAQCTLLLRQKCSPTKCADMIGSMVVSIDPGFLDSSGGG